MEYYEIFGLDPILNLDLTQLETKFHELSRKYHPDFHTTESSEERERALRMTALLNDAYRTLRDATRRAEYLVRAQGFEVDGSTVPQALLAEVFEINEELEQLREARASGENTESLVEDLGEFREQIESRRRDYDVQLEQASEEWDRLVESGAPEAERRKHLERIADIVSQSSYIRNLEREIENEVTR